MTLFIYKHIQNEIIQNAGGFTSPEGKPSPKKTNSDELTTPSKPCEDDVELDSLFEQDQEEEEEEESKAEDVPESPEASTEIESPAQKKKRNLQ